VRLIRLLAGVGLGVAFVRPTELVGQSAPPVGAERLSVSKGRLELAPGREAWLVVSTYIQTSATSMWPAKPMVTLETSNPSVATVDADSVIFAHVVARSRGDAVITVRSTRDPKNVVTIPVTVRSVPPTDDAGVKYAATAQLIPTSGAATGAPLGPSELAVNVTLSNPTSSKKEVSLAGCQAWIRVYDNPSYAGKPLIDIPRGVECSVDPKPLILAPGQSQTFPAEGFRLTLSGQALAPGRYYVAAAVDRLNDLLNVPAGPVVIPSPNEGMTFSASTTVSDGLLRPMVSFTNTNSQPVRAEFGSCAVSLMAFLTEDRLGAPVWNSEQRRAANGFGYACLTYLVTAEIEPTATISPKEFNPTFSIAEMLGDSLPAGHYYFKVRAKLNWRSVELPAGEADVKK